MLAGDVSKDGNNIERPVQFPEAEHNAERLLTRPEG